MTGVKYEVLPCFCNPFSEKSIMCQKGSAYYRMNVDTESTSNLVSILF